MTWICDEIINWTLFLLMYPFGESIIMVNIPIIYGGFTMQRVKINDIYYDTSTDDIPLGGYY